MLISISISIVLSIVTILIHIIIALWCYRNQRRTGRAIIIDVIILYTNRTIATAPSQASIPHYENVELSTVLNASNDLTVEACAAYGVIPQRQQS